ncbi:ATP-binding cassette domain-containing protein [Paenibacillus sp. B01]|uniref:ATP-binding cassette domain-containing protein n=1 Tax=Paenibacillus sp. B01 TaxID=2660554 RepID=UPI00129B7455|nr:ATP-binding cassette domain-containing protein [Paenibacillus sp. B01]QGG56582.1 ATP-binding cassette domain-containing protein [Paenibacillus sp. B01]
MRSASEKGERLVCWNGHAVQAAAGGQLRTIIGSASLELRQGDWLALCGSNGSGKSTLLRELAGLGAPPDGIRHQRTAAFPYDVRPFAVVLQQPDAALVGSTAREDLILTLEYAGMEGSRILDAAEEALERFGLTALADTPAEKLSGGQKQLVAIAGAVAAGSPALLFDEATSMLDAESARLVLRQVRQLHRAGATVVWCTQRLEELESEDRVLAMADGSIEYSGSAEAFFKRTGGEASACERVGLAAPYPVRAAWALQERGVRLDRLPLRLEELAPAFEASADSRAEAAAGSRGNAAAEALPASAGMQRHEADGAEREGADPLRFAAEELIVEGFRPDAAAPGKGEPTELRLPPGRILLLAGSNGSGKSTLLESLAGLREPSSGSIRYGSEPLWLGKRPNRAALLQLGATLQQSETQWFARTVREELDYSARPFRLPPSRRAAAIADSLRRAGLPERLLEQDPLTLSGGQQRRLALACALVGGPEWLLLDEPAAGLDAEGLERLTELLQRHRASGGSAIVSAHSLAALLPIADSVAVMEDGRLKELLPAPEYARRLAERGDRAAPPPLLAAERFGAAADGRLWLEPEELAERLAADGPVRTELAAAPGIAAARTTDGVPAGQPSAPRRSGPAPVAASAETLLPDSGLPDPRALIASYLLVGAGIMAQDRWPGLLLALAGAALLAILQRERIGLYLPLARGYAVFALTLAAVAGIQLSPPAFEAAAAAQTLFKLSRLFAVLLLGLPLLSLLPPFRLQRAADQLLRPLVRFGVPVSRLTLSISLLFRFLPLLAGEWRRYSRIAAARGKLAARPGKVPAAMLSRIVLPFLLSLIRLGDAVADALEARGFGHGAAVKTSAFRLRLKRLDAGLLLAASAAWLLLLALR